MSSRAQNQLPTINNMPAKKTTTRRASAATPCSRWWVIYMDTPGEHHNSKSAVGPFSCHASATKHVHDDAVDTFMGMEGDLRSMAVKDWGETMAIVEERRRIRPVPNVTVKMALHVVRENAQCDVTASLRDLVWG